MCRNKLDLLRAPLPSRIDVEKRSSLDRIVNEMNPNRNGRRFTRMLDTTNYIVTLLTEQRLIILSYTYRCFLRK